MDVDHHALAIDIAELQVPGLIEPESHGVGGPVEQGDSLDPARVDDGVDLVDGEDFGEGLGLLELHGGERFPGTLASSCVEELDAGEGDSDGAVGELLFVFEVQEVASELPLGDPIGLRPCPVGELPDGS